MRFRTSCCRWVVWCIYIYIHVPIGNSFYHSKRHQKLKKHKQKGVIYPRNAQETSSWWNYAVDYPTNYTTLKGWYQFGLNMFNNPNVHANRCLKKNNRCWFWIHGISWDSLRGARYGFGPWFPIRKLPPHYPNPKYPPVKRPPRCVMIQCHARGMIARRCACWLRGWVVLWKIL